MTRSTDQKRAIRHAMRRAHRPLTAREVLELARDDVPRLGIATVYRNVKSLVEDGWLSAVELPGEPNRYELAAKEHHHHFQCDDCGRVYDVPGCPGDIDSVIPVGFEVERHEVLLYGRCPECAA